MYRGPKSPFTIDTHPRAHKPAPAHPHAAELAQLAVWRNNRQRAALMSKPAPENATRPAVAPMPPPLPTPEPAPVRSRALAFLAAACAFIAAPMQTLRRNRGNK